MRVLPLFALLVASVFAADTPDPKALMADAGKALLALGSFKMEQHMTLDMHGGNINNSMALDLKMAAQQGRFRMDISPAPFNAIMLSNDESMYVYLGALNQYMKKPPAESPEAFARSMIPGISGLMDKAGDALSTSKILREESIPLQGRQIGCWVVETTIGTLEVGAGAPLLKDGRQVSWIDKERKVLLKQSSDFDLQVSTSATHSDEQVKSHMEMVVTALDLAPAFRPDEFTFTPPAGAKLVDSIPGMPDVK